MYLLYMSVDSYVNMSVDDLTTELNTLQTKRIKPKLQVFIDKLIAYKRENPRVSGNIILQQLQPPTLSRQAARLTNIPSHLRVSYNSARHSSSSGGNRKSRKHGKSKKFRKSMRRR